MDNGNSRALVPADQVALAQPVAQTASMTVAQTATMTFVERIEQYWRLANMLVKSRMVAQKEPEQAMAILLKAHELGVPAMQAFASIHFFDGKIVTGSDLMAGLAAQRCGVRWKVERWDDEACSMVFSRPGWESIAADFTMKDAARAQLTGKDNWKKYPKDMLRWRAMARGIRTIAPDYFTGIYLEDEIEQAPYVQPTTVVEPSRTDELRNRLEAATSTEAAVTTGALLDSQRKALLDWCRRTSPTGSTTAEVPAELVEQARTLAAIVFDEGEDRTRVLDFIDMATPPLSDRQFKVLVGKLQLAEQARREYEQPSLLAG